ncbi:MAG TPA: type IV secretion system DNA-binding domain-containing protein [Bradyrhizobium sp.]|nr:type IV secretion system DNA-binding domain-containing protein [Bradyrhizobium sp.]
MSASRPPRFEGVRLGCSCRVPGRRQGVALVPSVPLGREREARHLLIVGSVGGGKTQTMLQLIEALVRGGWPPGSRNSKRRPFALAWFIVLLETESL